MPEASRRRNAAFGSDNSPLITDARRRKFDLLVHLVLNLAEPIALTGPRGIGKSTYLGQLADASTAFGIPCTVQCNETTSYEQILDEIRWALEFEAGGKPNEELDLNELLAVCLKRKRLVVVMLDDAGRLLPGMANALWVFACGHPGLRLVFAMRGDEYARASIADGIAFRSARPVEIPPLTLVESRQYIHELIAVHRRDMAPQRVSGRFIDTLYRRTGGVPGQIHEQLLQDQTIPAGLGRVNPVVAIAGGTALLVAGLASVWMLTSAPPGPSPTGRDSEVPPVAARPAPTPPIESEVPPVAPPSAAEPAPSASAPPPLSAEPPKPASVAASVDPVSKQPATPEDEPAKPAKPKPEPMSREELLAFAANFVQPSARSAELLPDYVPPPPPPAPTPPVAPSTPAEVAPAPTVAEIPASTATNAVEPKAEPSAGAAPVAPVSDSAVAVVAADAAEPQASAPDWASLSVPLEGFKDAAWLMQQSADGVVLQLVALGRPELIEQLAHALPPDAVRATFRSRKGRNNLYPLLLGPYPGPTEAAQALGALPGKWPGAFLRPINSVQQEIKRLRPSSMARPVAVAPKPKPKFVPPKPKPPQPAVRPRPPARPAARPPVNPPEPPATVEP